MDVTTESPGAKRPAVASVAAQPKRPWPTGLPEQIKTVAELLANSGKPLSLVELASRFAARGRWHERLPTILKILQALGAHDASMAAPRFGRRHEARSAPCACVVISVSVYFQE